MPENKILLIFTGGTICSFSNKDGEKKTDVIKAESVIVGNFRKSGSKYSDIDFENRLPMNTLSENMTPEKWNTLLSAVKGYNLSEYKGVIFLHGTDTLSYTSSLLSLLLSPFDVPVFLVSSAEPLENPEANGNANFKTAVELIMSGAQPNVYVPYRNSDGKMYIHFGAHLEECKNHSNDFYSRDAVLTDGKEFKGQRFSAKNDFLCKMAPIKPSVLKINPYVGLDYSVFNTDNISAAVHGTYHSETLCAEENGDEESFFSVFYLLKKLRSRNVPVFIEPCRYNEAQKTDCYETTAKAVKAGAVPVYGMTSEMVYVKALLGVSLGKRGKDLADFVISENVNGEIHY